MLRIYSLFWRYSKHLTGFYTWRDSFPIKQKLRTELQQQRVSLFSATYQRHELSFDLIHTLCDAQTVYNNLLILVYRLQLQNQSNFITFLTATNTLATQATRRDARCLAYSTLSSAARELKWQLRSRHGSRPTALPRKLETALAEGYQSRTTRCSQSDSKLTYTCINCRTLLPS